MKLHLPKMLRVAVIAAITCVTIQPVMGADVILTASNICGPEDDETTVGTVEGTRYLDVYYKEGVAGTQKIDVSYNNYVWEGNLVVGDIIENNIVASQGDVNKVGGIKKNNSTWTLVAPDSNLNGFKFTNNFTVKGDLTVQGDGEIVLGGQPAEWDYSKKKYKNGSKYTGLEVTGKLAVTGGSLTATKIITNDLQVSDGTVKTHTSNCTSGNSNAGGVKQSYIKNSLTISGGTLSFGYTGNVQGIGGGGHRMTAFGSSASFVMTQTGGKMRVYGDMDMKSGTTINQSAGTMVLRDTIYMGGSGTTTINQTGAATLVLGRLESTSSSSTPNFDINQSGAGLIHLAYGSNFAAASTIDLTQTGGGTINFGGGHDTSITDTLPNRGYELNSSPAEAINTTHDISQTDGLINIKKNGIVNAGEVSIGDTVTVYDGGILGSTYGVLEYSDKKWQTVAGTNAPVIVTSEGVLDMQEGSSYGVSFQKSAFAQVGEDTCAAVINGGDKLSKKVELDFGVIALNGADTTKLDNGFALFNMDGRLWSLKAATWRHEDGLSYVDGTLVYDYWIDLTSGGEVKEVFSDTSSYLQTGLKISGSDITLNATNTHSYGTIIDGGTNGITVTLKNVSALGNGPVMASGTSTVTSSTTAKLPSTIQNSGDLTLKGKFSTTSDSLEQVGESESVLLSLAGQESTDGFAAEKSVHLLVKQEDNSKVTFKSGATVKVNELTYALTQNGNDTVIDGEDVTIVAYTRDNTKYYMNTEEHDITIYEIWQKASNSAVVYMGENAGTLTVDKDALSVEAKGGKIDISSGFAVKGRIENAVVSGNNGTVNADLKGGVTLKGTLNISGTGITTGTLALDGAAVTLGAESALGDAELSTAGTNSLSAAGEMVIKLNHAISNTGTLTMSGIYDVSSLESKEINPCYVDTNGDVTSDGNGFKCDDGRTVLVVNNANDGRLEEGESLQMTIGTRYDGVLDKTTGVVTFVAGGDYSTYRMVEAVEESAHAIIDASVGASGPQVEKVAMTAGTLKVDASITVDAEDGTTLKMTGNDVKLTGEIDGASTSVQVTGSGIIEGNNSYSGGTVIDGGKLTVASDTALGTGKVSLKGDGSLNLGSKAVANDIEAAGGVLRGADQYLGNLVVSEDLTIEGSATAKSITMRNKADIVLQSAATYSRRSTPAASQVSTDAMYVRTEGDGSFTGSLTLNEGGLIELNNGNSLVVTGTLTLGNGTKLVLNGDYAAGDTLVSATESLTLGDVTLVYDNNAVVMEQQGNSLVLVGNFKQEEATASTLSNWGIATASRAVVNAVRGQRSNTGCIANGKGTAWVASLGSKHEINGSDIDISGAAVGADTQLGRNSRIGIALGYAEGEVQPAGLRQVDQEGSYIAAYGEHGLKKLSATSCLSMDWVAAYGTTDSEVGGLKWEQDSLQLNSRVNWNKKVNNRLCMSVFGGLEYFANNSDTVEGVKTGSIQNLRGEIGVGARYVAWGTPAVTDGKSGLVLAQGCEKLVLNGEVRYMNDMVRSNPVIRMNGLSGMGENPGRQGIGIEAGATYRIGERWSASANYGFNTMEDSKEHRLNIGAAYTF